MPKQQPVGEPCRLEFELTEEQVKALCAAVMRNNGAPTVIMPTPKTPAELLFERCEKLSPKTGDVFVLPYEAGNISMLNSIVRTGKYVYEKLMEMYGVDVFFIALPSDMTLAQVNEEQMNAAGWFRRVEEKPAEQPPTDKPPEKRGYEFL